MCQNGNIPASREVTTGNIPASREVTTGSVLPKNGNNGLSSPKEWLTTGRGTPTNGRGTPTNGQRYTQGGTPSRYTLGIHPVGYTLGIHPVRYTRHTQWGTPVTSSEVHPVGYTHEGYPYGTPMRDTRMVHPYGTPVGREVGIYTRG